jgi:aspartyl-tRNA(Asn)/glutamyl-tRNA(Gln) amidotransferase subunit A
MVTATPLLSSGTTPRTTPVTIAHLSTQVRDQRISPVAIVQQCLARIEALQPTVNAFITVLADQALADAKTAELEIAAGRWRGPLHGVPVGIKDMFDTAGIRTTAAFEHFRNRVPTEDAVAVRKLKEAGAIIIGKTNMHKLAMGTTSVDSYFGAVHNPYNVAHIAGGSSGGSAAAVATGMCYATLDTDAIGSCRLPASCCGVTGFKGTYALINNRGILAGEPVDDAILWLAHAAITTQSAEDTALLLNAMAEPNDSSRQNADYRIALQQIQRPRIGRVSNFSAQRRVKSIFEAAVHVLCRLGVVTDVLAPLSPGFDVHHIEADRKNVTESLFDANDVIVLPTAAVATPTITAIGSNALGLSPQNTQFANYYGLPAISVPCGFDHHGLPVGLQIVGKAGDDETVLRLAHQYQQAVTWGRSYPMAPADIA